MGLMSWIGLHDGILSALQVSRDTELGPSIQFVVLAALRSTNQAQLKDG
jgi:hypothetical protein